MSGDKHLNTLFEINNVSFEYPNGQKIFENLNLSILADSKIGIVGVNGSGKTSLFKLIIEALIPTNGHVKRYGKVAYVPQTNLEVLKSDTTLENYLINKCDDHWKVYSLLNELFSFDYDLNSKVNKLSGGEIIKINIAIALSQSPDLLLLDEPTNHLDISSIQKIVQFLNQTSIAFLVVSHDIFFLDQVVKQIWEIDNKKVEVFGGNYSDYKEQKRLQIESKLKIIESAENKLKQANAIKQKELQRTARNFKNKKKERLEGGLIKWEFTPGERGKPSLSNAFIKKVSKIKAQAQTDLENNQINIRKLSNITIKNANQKDGQTLIRTQDLSVRVANKTLINNLDFTISYGDRINIAGKNGSGKTLLIKNLISQNETIYYKNDLKYLYIDQHYSLLNFDKNLIENMSDFLPNISESEIKKLLGQMQFKNVSDYKKKANNLSGGELARLTLAIVGALPIELLILDEPTNNLDVETIDIMIEALNRYQGALMVISHNVDFLSKLKITSSYIIKNHKLKRMINLPSNKDLYYEEILE